MSDKRILDALFQKKCLSKSDYICLLDKYCPRNERDFLSRCLLAAGSGLVLAGIVCFFAANWSRLGDVLKLGLPLAGLVGCGLGAFWKGLEKTSAQAFVFGAAVLLGVMTFAMRSVLVAKIVKISGTTVNLSKLFAGRATLVGAIFLNLRLFSTLLLWVLYAAGIFAVLLNFCFVFWFK